MLDWWKLSVKNNFDIWNFVYCCYFLFWKIYLIVWGNFCIFIFNFLNYFGWICFCVNNVEMENVIIEVMFYYMFNWEVWLFGFIVFIYFIKINSYESFFICWFINIRSDYFFYNSFVIIFFLLNIRFLLICIVS